LIANPSFTFTISPKVPYPGTSLIEWAGGFLSALNYLYKDTKGMNYENIKTQLFFEKFEIIPLNMIQGVSILEGEILIVDEVQLITKEYMSMILSRMSEGSKSWAKAENYGFEVKEVADAVKDESWFFIFS
jgi:predicted ribonuclease YlaK